MALVERRKHLRYSCDLDVEVRPAEQAVTYPGKLADICLGGCFVSTVSPLPEGTAVTVVFHAPGLEVTSGQADGNQPAGFPSGNGNGAAANGGAGQSISADGTTAIAGRTVTSLPGNGMGIEFTVAAGSESSARLKALIHMLENGASMDARKAI